MRVLGRVRTESVSRKGGHKKVFIHLLLYRADRRLLRGKFLGKIAVRFKSDDYIEVTKLVTDDTLMSIRTL